MSQTFKVRMTVEYEVQRPDDWDENLLDFQLNEGSWCGDNAFTDIKEFAEKEGKCLCSIAEFEVIE